MAHIEKKARKKKNRASVSKYKASATPYQQTRRKAIQQRDAKQTPSGKYYSNTASRVRSYKQIIEVMGSRFMKKRED